MRNNGLTAILFFLLFLLTNIVMASESNTNKLIEDYYKAILDQDVNGFVSLLSDDVVHEINQASTETGKAKFKTFMEDQFSHGKIEIKDMIVLTSKDGKYATTRFICAGTYSKNVEGYPQATAQHWEIPVVSFFKVNANKISHVAVYYNSKEFENQLS